MCGIKVCTHFPWKGHHDSLETSAHVVHGTAAQHQVVIQAHAQERWVGFRELGGVAELGPGQYLFLVSF